MNEAARSITDLVRPIAFEAARQEGAELIDMEFRREPAGWVLRLYIDKVGGVTLSDCQRVSEVVGTLLEVEDLIPHAYTLEVSSPGLTRPLQSPDDWRRAVGSLVRIVTRQPVAGRQAIVGRLLEVRPGTFVVDEDGETVEVPGGMVARARREPEWPSAAAGKGRPGRRERGDRKNGRVKRGEPNDGK